MRDIHDCLMETKGMVRELRKRGISAAPCPVWVCVMEGKNLRLHCGFNKLGVVKEEPNIYYGHLVTRLRNGLILDPRAYRFIEAPGFTPPRWVRFVGYEFHIRSGNFDMAYYVVDDQDWVPIYKRSKRQVDLDALEQMLTPSPNDDPEVTSRLASL